MAKSRDQRVLEVKRIIDDEPGIRASEVAKQCNTSEATICLVVAALKQAEEVEQVRDGNGRGLGLRASDASRRRQLLRKRWG